MKKTVLLSVLTVIAFACNKSPKGDQNLNENDSVSEAVLQTDTGEQLGGQLNMDEVPFSTADLGVFPFFNMPQGLEASQPLQKKFDVCFFPVNGVMTAVEGRLYKANIRPVSGEDFSQRYFEKSFEDYLFSVGAVKVFDGEITSEEYERYSKSDPNKGDEGDIGYTGQQIKYYVIRSKDQGNIHVQLTANTAGGALNVLQEEVFEQTIKKVLAADISKDLNEKGKAVLYIQFDVDKSNITTAGAEAVIQIAQVLKQDKNLKIAVEGHTDNTGDAIHNKKLSNDRANAVMNAVVSSGIDKTRLSAKGFGSDRPLVSNDSEQNKSKNRRVELIKTN